MRIQHNIMAMSAYRNYNTNTSALSKNLEKLSSGYKINRAGDDAAGLAISEKMRAQITGLNAAQKNVKDGISLVKTAEGAMQEIQDMLNRMDYLATQSANGTYQDEVDRENLNKEMVALKTEINRIADSANFNGIKLLDGSLEEGYNGKADALKAAEDAQAAADAALADAENATGETVFGEETALPIHTTMATNNKPSTTGAAETVLETDYEPSGKPGFSVTMNGITHTFNDVTADSSGAAGSYVSIKINDGTSDLEIKLGEDDIAAAYKEVTGETAKAGDTATSEMIAKAAAKYIETNGLKASSPTAGEVEIAGGNIFTARADGDQLVFELKGEAQSDLAKVPNFTVKFQGVDKATVAAEGPKYTTGEITQTGTAGSESATATVKYKDADGNEKTVDITFDSGTGAAATATALKTALGNNADLAALFDIGGDDKGITLTAKTEDSTAAVTGVEIKTAGTDGVKMGAGTAAEAHDAYTTGTSGYTNSGTPVTIQTGAEKIDQLASTVVKLDNTQVVDGAAIRLGDQTYVFAVGEDSQYKNAENAIYVELATGDYTETNGEITLTAGDGKGLDKYVTKLVEVAANNETFTVSHRGVVGEIGLKQKAEVKETTDMSTKEKLQSYIGITSVDEEATADNTAAAVEAAKASAAKLQTKADELKKAAESAVDGNPLNLQIGDSSDDFNQMKVSIGNMHVAAMQTENEDGTTTSIADIDILTSDHAQAAVDVIKNAINYVSGIRGDLGAYQNRLEHTANNLSVMAENIQDAESTIRDTDIAEEMMSYTKNNILVQSAQAMLAQANAVPQGVLQLLG